MQEIKFCLEVPIPLLDKLNVHLDLHMAIAHLVLEDKTYQQYYKAQVANGRTVILDNSTFEKGEPLPMENIIQAAKDLCWEHLRPILIAPDFPGDKTKTLDASFAFLREAQRNGFKCGACAQGNDVDDVIDCYRELIKAPFEPLCFTFMSPRYHVLLDQPMIYNRWHHLFGTYGLDEIRWLRTFIPFPQCLSLDTVKPFKAALYEHSLKSLPRGLGKWDPYCNPPIGPSRTNIYDLQLHCRGMIGPHPGIFRIPKLVDNYWRGSFHREG